MNAQPTPGSGASAGAASPMTRSDRPRHRAPSTTAVRYTTRVSERGVSRFARRLALVSLAGFALRVAYVLLFRVQHVPLLGDSYFFSEGANLLARGHGFVEPLAGEQSANHPPLYVLWLALSSVVDPHSTTSQELHMLWSCVLGTGTVVVSGLAGREVCGPRCGLVVAGVAAVYPGLWVWDGMLFSETMAQFTVALVILLAYRFWRHPSAKRAVWLGFGCGLAALSRSELILSVPFVLVPLALRCRTVVLSRRLFLAAFGALAVALTLAPWVALNLSRFKEPVYLSTNFGGTLAAANCDATYYGNDIGYKNYLCAQRLFEAAERADPSWFSLDVSQKDSAVRKRSLRYVRSHLSRLPAVIAARLARITGFYRREQEISADRVFYKREKALAEAASWSFYVAAGAAVAGGLVLLRRRTPVFPLVAFPIIILVSVTVTFGQDRYRAPAEVALIVLSAVAVDALITRGTAVARQRRRGNGDAPASSSSLAGESSGR